VLVRELDERFISFEARLDGDLGEHPTSACVDRCSAVRRDVGVDADHDVDDLGQTFHALLLCPEGRGCSGPEGERQDCDGTRRRRTPEAVKLLIRPEL
jgi:hypothetical protein